MSTAVTPRSAPLTPQNPWARAGQNANGPLCQFAGESQTDANICALNTKSDSQSSDFADDSTTPPRWVVKYPGGVFVTHRVFMGVEENATLDGTQKCVMKLAYFRDDTRRKSKVSGMGNSYSPEIFGKVVCSLESGAIPLSTEEKQKYLPPDAPAADWYWVSTYTFSLTAAHGGISVAASIPPSFRYDFNGNSNLAVYAACTSAFDDTNRRCVACGFVTSGQ